MIDMKEIKYRAKTLDGKTVYGTDLLHNKVIVDNLNDERYYLLFNPKYELKAIFNYLMNPIKFSHLKESVFKVIPESICRFTGLQDKNKKDIYEKDILQYYNDKMGNKLLVTFEWGMFYAVCDDLWHYVSKNAYIVIGNSFDSPELLKK
jgi:hypothetical protein